MKRQTISEILYSAIIYIILTFLTIVTVYPLIHIAFASFSTGSELMAHEGLLIKPLGFTLDGYKAVFQNSNIISGYKNTLIIIVVGVSLSLLLTIFGAYALSRKSFYLKKIVMVLIIFTMYFNGGLIPNYLNVQSLGLVDSLWALILPNAINVFNLIIMRTSFESIPDSLEESAKIDGANDFIILFKIIIPLSGSVLAVMGLYYGVAYWNAWFGAMLYISNRELYPLQIVLKEILFVAQQAAEGTDIADYTINISETLKYSLIMVATVPILCVYPFLQKYFVKGVMVGAVKG